VKGELQEIPSSALDGLMAGREADQLEVDEGAKG